MAGGGARGRVRTRGPGRRPWSAGQGAGPAAPSSSRDAAPSLGSQAPTMAHVGLDCLGLCWAGPQRGGPRPRERPPACAAQVLSERPSPTRGALLPRRGRARTLNPPAPPSPALHASRRWLLQHPPRELPVVLCAQGASLSSRGWVAPSVAAAGAWSPVGGRPCLAVVLNAAAVDAPEPAPMWTCFHFSWARAQEWRRGLRGSLLRNRWVVSTTSTLARSLRPGADRPRGPGAGLTRASHAFPWRQTVCGRLC